MPDDTTPPFEVSTSPATAQIAAAARVLVLLIGVVTALAGFVSKHDLAGFVAYIQSSQFLAAAGVIASAAAFIIGQIKTRVRAKQLATLACDPAVPQVQPKA